MALIYSYLVTTKNLESFFTSLITAKAPDTFTIKFLQNLEFKSTNDRLYIGLLKGLGFLDENGTPTERYFNFLDQSNSKKILAEAIREAYSDLFSVNINASKLEAKEVKNKLRTLVQGKYSETVLHLMANTFKALVDYADWDEDKKDVVKKKETTKKKTEELVEEKPDLDKEVVSEISETPSKTQLHYNIQIHLPETRDPAVYEILFKSLKKHLT